MTNFLHIFKEPFVVSGLTTSLLLGSLCAYLGIFLVLKRIVFVGAALSQLAAMGIAFGHLLGQWVHVSHELMAYIFALTGAFIFWIPFKNKKLSKESLIGFVFALAGTAAIVLLSKDPSAEAEDLDLMSGNLLFVSNSDLIILTAVVFIIGFVHWFFQKEFLFVSFDHETAQTLKIPAHFYEFILYFTLGLTVAVGIKMAGLLYVFGSLIIPAVIGLKLFDRLSLIALAAIVSIVISSVLGVFLSYIWDLPTAPAITTINGLIFLLASILKK